MIRQWISGTISNIIHYLRRLFAKEEMDIVLVGLQAAGKSTLVDTLVIGHPSQRETIPTVGFNLQSAKHGGITFKLCDLAGQRNYRGEWVCRFCGFS